LVLRFLRTLVVCSLAVAAVALPAAPASASSPGQRAVASLNKIRASHGLGPLRVSPSLRRSSGRYARLMLKQDFFGHQARISVSRRFRRGGETLALHYGRRVSAGWEVRAWMHSPPHRRLLMSRRFTWVGISAARGRMGRQRAVTWVGHFGKR
jgi:uncharacterized protein YkwD